MGRREISIDFSLSTSIFFFVFYIFSCRWVQPCSAASILYATQSIRDGQTLSSTNNLFELGFFSPTNSQKRYLGIWCLGYSPKVWVANRENPLEDRSGILTIQENGSLAVVNGNKQVVWSTSVSLQSNVTIAVIMDTGNFELKEGNSTDAATVWESFNHPSDTIFPGMKLGINLRTGETKELRSWKSSEDPAPGNFAFGIDPDGLNQFFIWRRSVPYWRSVFWNGTAYDAMVNPFSTLVNFSIINNEDGVYFTFESPSPLVMLVMDHTGTLNSLEMVTGGSSIGRWTGEPDPCSTISSCGPYTSCNVNNRPQCKCLPGFVRNSETWTDGCHRMTQLRCGEENGVLSLKSVEVSPPAAIIASFSNNEEGCRDYCSTRDCNCRGYSFNGSTCYDWRAEDLQGIREEENFDERLALDINIIVAASDLKADRRQCDNCGTYTVPYPLSTDPNCGDPAYGALLCNTTTGQLLFRTLNGSHAISSINPDTRTLVIKPEGIDLCWARSANRSDIYLNDSQRFHLTNNNTVLLFNCSTDCTSSDVCRRYIQEGRAPCFDLNKCCSYVAQDSSHMVGVLRRRCGAYASIVGLNALWDTSEWWEGIEIRWDAPPETKGQLPMIISGTVIASVLLLGMLVYIVWRKMIKKKGYPRFYGSFNETFGEDGRKEMDVPFFEFDCILDATEKFSDSNKLGRGGFGPVYKGKLPDGQELAVKRLSKSSGQGQVEFKNEVMLIAKLQHKNLVRLLGYCIEGDERILLYEYMPNKSLDYHLFDPNRSKLLSWEKRHNIILGIARGLLYLHEDSRLTVIHRDLKTSNVLLDEEMKPKISDFGMARIFGANQIQENTNRVVGTYGYMSPEYASHGLFSVKSDVFSFGVILLEIVSGTKNTLFYHSEQSLSLVGHAWKLWTEGKWIDLMDRNLDGTTNSSEVEKCIHIGLLCVQENTADRPTMSSVAAMLVSETTSIPVPKPAAFLSRSFIYSDSSNCSKNEVTISTLECR